MYVGVGGLFKGKDKVKNKKRERILDGRIWISLIRYQKKSKICYQLDFNNKKKIL